MPVKIKICEYCGQTYTHKRKHYRVCPNRRHPENFKWSAEEKLNLSNKRKQYLKNNPDKHNWAGNNIKWSVYEDIVSQFLINNNVEIQTNYCDSRWTHRYKIDIAILCKKIAIEINGNQHYISTTGNTLTEYYQQRHNFLVNAGWTVIELRCADCTSEKLQFLLIDIINHHDILTNEYADLCYYDIVQVKLRNNQEQQIKHQNAAIAGKLNSNNHISSNKLSIDEINMRKQLIINAGVDLTKYGWVSKVEKITGLTRRQINNIVNSTNLKDIVFYRKY